MFLQNCRPPVPHALAKFQAAELKTENDLEDVASWDNDQIDRFVRSTLEQEGRDFESIVAGFRHLGGSVG